MKTIIFGIFLFVSFVGFSLETIRGEELTDKVNEIGNELDNKIVTNANENDDVVFTPSNVINPVYPGKRKFCLRFGCKISCRRLRYIDGRCMKIGLDERKKCYCCEGSYSDDNNGAMDDDDDDDDSVGDDSVDTEDDYC